MAEEFDIDENVITRDVFPDISTVKDEVFNYYDSVFESTPVSIQHVNLSKGYKPIFQEETTFPIADNPESQLLKANIIILGSKPNRVSVDEDDIQSSSSLYQINGSKLRPSVDQNYFEELVNCCSEPNVVLHDIESYLHKSNRFCDICSILFPEQSRYNSHVQRYHTHKYLSGIVRKRQGIYKTSKHKCPICAKIFVAAHVVRRHLKNIHNFEETDIAPQNTSHNSTDLTNTCFHCKKAFDTQKSLIDHLYEILQMKRKETEIVPVLKSVLFKCNKCDIHFTSSLLAANHAEHMEMLVNWKCTICNRIFKKEDELSHERQHSVSNRFRVYNLEDLDVSKILFRCSKCSTHFSESNFLYHFRDCGLEVTKSVYCKTCNILLDYNTSHEPEKHTDLHRFIIIETDVISDNPVKPIRTNFRMKNKFHKSDKSLTGAKVVLQRICLSELDTPNKSDTVKVSTSLESPKTIPREQMTVKTPKMLKDAKGRVWRTKLITIKKRKDADQRLKGNKGKMKNLLQAVSKNKCANINAHLDLKKHSLAYYYCETCKCFIKKGQNRKGAHLQRRCEYLVKTACGICGLVLTISSIGTHNRLHEEWKELELQNFSFFHLYSGKSMIPPVPEYPKCVNCAVHFLSIAAINDHICGKETFVTCHICERKLSEVAFKLHMTFHNYTMNIKKLVTSKKNHRLMTSNLEKSAKIATKPANIYDHFVLKRGILAYNYCETCKCFITKGFRKNTHLQARCKKLSKTACGICGLVLTSASIGTHNRLHEEWKNLQLENYSFFNLYSGKSMMPPVPEYPRCVGCAVHFLSKAAMNKHVCSKEAYVTCHICHIKLSEEAHKLHMSFHHYAKDSLKVDTRNKSHSAITQLIETNVNSAPNNQLHNSLNKNQLHNSLDLVDTPAQNSLEAGTSKILQSATKPHIKTNANKASINRNKFHISLDLVDTPVQNSLEAGTSKISQSATKPHIKTNANKASININKFLVDTPVQNSLEAGTSKFSQSATKPHIKKTNANKAINKFHNSLDLVDTPVQNSLEAGTSKISQTATKPHIKTNANKASININKFLVDTPVQNSLEAGTSKILQSATKPHIKKTNANKAINKFHNSLDLVDTPVQNSLEAGTSKISQSATKPHIKTNASNDSININEFHNSLDLVDTPAQNSLEAGTSKISQSATKPHIKTNAKKASININEFHISLDLVDTPVQNILEAGTSKISQSATKPHIKTNANKASTNINDLHNSLDFVDTPAQNSLEADASKHLHSVMTPYKTNANSAFINLNDLDSGLDLVDTPVQNSLTDIYEVIYTCRNCSISVDSYDKVVEHSQDHYKNEGKKILTEICNYCNLNIEKTCYTEHHSLHKNGNKFKLLKFDSSFLPSENYQWVEHIFGNVSKEKTSSILSRSIYRFECRIKMHVIQHGDPDLTVYKCDQCCCFIDPSALFKHSDNSCFKLRQHPCTICGLPFISSASRIEHEKIHNFPGITVKSYRIVLFNCEQDKLINRSFCERKTYVLYKCRNCDIIIDKLHKDTHKCDVNDIKKCPDCALLLHSDDYESHVNLHKEFASFHYSNMKVILLGDDKSFNARSENTRKTNFKGAFFDYQMCICNKCEISIKSKKNMSQHRCCFGKQRAKCLKCDLYFSVGRLKTHTRCHERDPDFLRSNMNLVYFDPYTFDQNKNDTYKCIEEYVLIDSSSDSDSDIVSVISDTKLNGHDTVESIRIAADSVTTRAEDTAKVYKCTCELHFLNEDSIIRHFGVCGSKARIAKQKCPKCALLFTPNVLFTHLLAHHSNKKRRYKYDIIEMDKIIRLD